MFLLSIALSLTLFLSDILEAATVYISVNVGSDPQTFFYQIDSERDETAKPFIMLREALERNGYIVKFTNDGLNLDDFAGFIAINPPNFSLINILPYKNKSCLYFFEPNVTGFYTSSFPDYFGKLFVMHDDLVNNKNYFKLHYPQPNMHMIEDIPDFSQKKFATMIAGNKDCYPGHPKVLYAERRKAIRFFEEHHPSDFDLYGVGWHAYSSWKGAIPNKCDVLKQYKFSICYENMKDQTGYITEKIFDSLRAGCVPVYLGASNIQDYIPKECFIDRREFATDEEMYSFLKEISPETYSAYLKSIRCYFESEAAHLFSIDYFIHTVMQGIDSD